MRTRTTRGRCLLLKRKLIFIFRSTRATTTSSSVLVLATMASALVPQWESIKDNFVGGPYAGAGGMATGGSVGVEAFVDDEEAIRAVRMFPVTNNMVYAARKTCLL